LIRREPANLFNDAVDCFEYVELGRNCTKDFQTNLLKLDIARLRLSRWGASVGVNNGLGDVRGIRMAVKILDCILKVFSEAERESTKFKACAKPGDNNLLVYNTQTDLEDIQAQLHNKMRKLSIERQGRPPLEKTKWAVYQEKSLRALTEDITDLVNDLVELSPAAQESQRKLCETEVYEIGTNKSLPVLKDIATDRDKYLEAAITKAMENRMGSNISFSGQNYGFQLGQNFGIQLGGNFGIQLGQSFYGRTPTPRPGDV
jgi:hypothetical protein